LPVGHFVDQPHELIFVQMRAGVSYSAGYIAVNPIPSGLFLARVGEVAGMPLSFQQKSANEWEKYAIAQSRPRTLPTRAHSSLA